MGLSSKNGGLAELEALSASCFCRRRLATVLVVSHFCETLEQAISVIEGGRKTVQNDTLPELICSRLFCLPDIRLGPDLVTDPAFHVTREMADHIAWAEGSSMKRCVSVCFCGTF